MCAKKCECNTCYKKYTCTDCSYMYLNNNVSCPQDGVHGCKYYQYFYDQIKDYKKGNKYADAKNHSS